MTGLHDTAARRKEESDRQEKKDSAGFEDVFKKACADITAERRDISYNAGGYTKTGLAYDYLEMRRQFV